MKLEVQSRRGWEILCLTSDVLEAAILPGKGGDVLSLRALAQDLELLWQTPWGLRRHGAVPTAGDSAANLMENYPGGWQTVFPNGGAPVAEHGTEWGMHGEAWLAPWDWAPTEDGVELSTRLVRCPFSIVKRFALVEDRLVVTETVHNVGEHPVEVMWSHHPAFGGPLIARGCRLETAARTFVVDDERVTPRGDLQPGARAAWPHVPGRDGHQVDVSLLPAVDDQCERLGYLTDFQFGLVSLVNDELGTAVDIEWDASVFPCAWLWVEAHATPGFPWYQAVHVVAVEPATSWPGQGLAAVRLKTGTQLAVQPDERRTATVAVRVRSSGPAPDAVGDEGEQHDRG